MKPLFLLETNRETHKIHLYEPTKEEKENVDNRHVTFAKKRYSETDNDIVKQEEQF